MPIVGGLDIHRKQLTFDYLDTVTGEVKRGQVAPADRAHLRAWLARFACRDDVAFALEGCTGWRYVAEELAGPASRRTSASRLTPRSPGAASGTPDRQDRLAAPEGAAGPGQAARVLDPAGAHPGVPGAARAVSRSAGRAHRLGTAHPRGVLPPGRSGSGRRGRCAPDRAWPRCGGPPRSPVPGRSAAGRHRTGGDRGAGGPDARGAASAANGCPAPGRRQGPGRSGCTGSAR